MKLRALASQQNFGPIISHIRFPLFKNLQRGSRIGFTFPVTALVGSNGCGKTSALHALYGAPRGQSTSDFWFATDVDPIKEGNGEPNRFIYGHWLAIANQVVETRKARVSGGENRRPGYFEPTKAVIGDGMDLSPFPPTVEIPGQSKDRWNPVDRPVLYMNFRSELSAFDKYLFWGDPKPTKTMPTRYDRLQLGAKRLKKAIESGASPLQLNGAQVVSINRDLTAREMECVCAILGKDYTSARLIQHKYYGDSEGLSVRFETSHATYSEAFAGSGELAVASLVVKLCSAKERTLVLLDEPEVSLHPGAQERLLIFLMEEALLKKHQIVFTTHSPGLIRLLPPDAIKVFYQSADGRFDVINETHPHAAFNRLGAAVPHKIRILVEDRLAKHVVDMALRLLDDGERGLFDVTFLPGGSQTYLVHRIPTLMYEPFPAYVVLDGDQKPVAPFPDPDSIPASDNGTLAATIKDLVGADPKLSGDGGNDPATLAHLNELRRRYLRFLYTQVHYLPRSSPEAIVLKALQKDDYVDLSAQEAKTTLAAMVRNALGFDTSDGVDNWALVKLADERVGNEDLEKIGIMLREFLQRKPTCT